MNSVKAGDNMVGDISGPRSHGVDNKATRSSSSVNPVADKASSNSSAGANSEAGSVQLSSQAQSLAAVEAKAKAASEVNAEKVASIRTAIADGSYSIDAVHVAEKLLTLESELGD
ncbi:MAG: flagellar biosynthesis anti-sigma factor FlgM [Pseudomonadales bacterium]